MIPSAILSGELQIDDIKLEFSVLEISTQGFLFRALPEYRDIFQQQKISIHLHFFRFDQAAYTEVFLTDCQISVSEETQYYTLYDVCVPESECYEAAVKHLTSEYLSYIRLFQEEEPEDMARALVGYPAEKEKIYPSSYEALCGKIRESLQVKLSPRVKLGLALETPWQQEQFLRSGPAAFTGIPGEVEYLYIGNQWCIHLLPSFEILVELIEKCQTQGVTFVYQLPPIKESEMPVMKNMMEKLAVFFKENKLATLEVVVNDWGMLEYLSDYSTFSLTMGILMLKQKKDPRRSWKNGADINKAQRKRPGWMTEEFLHYTQERYHVSRYSMECVDSIQKEAVPQVPITVYGPWYQMNTSTLCPLQAAVLEGDRGKQKERTSCEHLCREWNFLYPEHLHMAGRYNSLWGYQEKIEVNADAADRLVWNLIEDIKL